MSGKKTKVSLYLKIFISAYIIIYLLLLFAGHMVTGGNRQWDKIILNPIEQFNAYFFSYDTTGIPLVKGKSESCLYCHDGLSGFAEAHNPKNIGCSSCHLGNMLSIDKEDAHQDMVKIPGNLNDASFTCGRVGCHLGIDIRVKNSIMNTMSGVVGVNRFAFGETDSLNQLYRIEEIGNSAADTHLRNLCASCHLGNPKEEYGPIVELSRGGGCNACHLNYSASALQQLQRIKNKTDSDSHDIRFHPSLDLNISDAHCFGCHSRSGRISTNYQGWHETQIEADHMPVDSSHRLLDDGRVFKKV